MSHNDVIMTHLVFFSTEGTVRTFWFLGSRKMASVQKQENFETNGLWRLQTNGNERRTCRRVPCASVHRPVGRGMGAK